jgi:Pyrimidine dimer DNA glycosylase
VRIWDVDVRLLCDRHLLGEHRELHALWTVQTEGKRGYARHPETLRWRGRLAALYARHEAQVAEFERRGFRHGSPLDRVHATGETKQTEFVDPLDAQLDRLAQLGCGCVVGRTVDGRRSDPSPP